MKYLLGIITTGSTDFISTGQHGALKGVDTDGHVNADKRHQGEL